MLIKLLAKKIYKKMQKENFDYNKLTTSINKSLENEKVLKEYNKIAGNKEQLIPLDKIFVGALYKISNINSQVIGYLTLKQQYMMNFVGDVFAVLLKESYGTKYFETIPFYEKVEMSDSGCIRDEGDFVLKDLTSLTKALNTKFIFYKDLQNMAKQLGLTPNNDEIKEK